MHRSQQSSLNLSPIRLKRLSRQRSSNGCLRRNVPKNLQRQQALHNRSLQLSHRSSRTLLLSLSKWFRTCLSECEIGTGSTRNFSRNGPHKFNTLTTWCGENSVRNLP